MYSSNRLARARGRYRRRLRCTTSDHRCEHTRSVKKRPIRPQATAAWLVYLLVQRNHLTTSDHIAAAAIAAIEVRREATPLEGCVVLRLAHPGQARTAETRSGFVAQPRQASHKGRRWRKPCTAGACVASAGSSARGSARARARQPAASGRLTGT